MEKYIALVPAYEPEPVFIRVLQDLQKQGMEIVVVDDGSGGAYREIFREASRYAHILTHQKNRGKGAALKTGLQYIWEHYRGKGEVITKNPCQVEQQGKEENIRTGAGNNDKEYLLSGEASEGKEYSQGWKDDNDAGDNRGTGCNIVTVDADGQHSAEDACRICHMAEQFPDTLILGSRRMKGKVPLRSRLGNGIITQEKNGSQTGETSQKENADAAKNSADENGQQKSQEEPETKSIQDVVITDTSYTDANISITLTQYREYDTDIYVADIELSDLSYLQTALAQNIYGRNITAKTSETASQNQAILAINGDYYGAQEKGYVLRNGVLYRNTARSDQEDLVIYQDGSFEVIKEGEVSAEELLSRGAEQILSFGPALLTDGTLQVTEGQEVGKAKASNPRTAIGILGEGHYVFVVSDGRTQESEGLSLYELAEFMQGLGVTCAYNLDGGGSSAMYFNGEIVNNPTTDGRSIKERSVSDIVYIGY